MDIKYKYVQEEIIKNEIKLTLIGSNSVMADPLTKNISGPKLNYIVDFIMKIYAFNYIVHYTTLLNVKYFYSIVSQFFEELPVVIEFSDLVILM
ncbi:hypothetical protein H8356DRAFT_1348487 [Neocallimastix lanati (nom. inval.)]|nr:hypothetical protein H8356DRAFT_1348487 [Neocallimastix sp. JGI-2020a]